MFGIDGEALGKIVGGAAAAFAIGLLTWLGNRLNRKDAAEKPVPPAAMGFVIDGDTALAILAELKALHANQEKFHDEDARRREAEEKRGLEDDIRALRRQNDELKRGQGVSHKNQDELLEMIRGLMNLPGVAEERERIHSGPMIEHDP